MLSSGNLPDILMTWDGVFTEFLLWETSDRLTQVFIQNEEFTKICRTSHWNHACLKLFEA